MAYPDNCIKGIPNQDCLHVFADSVVATINLFCFPRDRCRADGWIEESVNWMDDDSALEFTLRQVRDGGELHFTVGIAVLPRTALDRVRKRYAGHFDYERAAIPGNSYHGNLLLKGQMQKHLMSQIRALLADAAEVRQRVDQ